MYQSCTGTQVPYPVAHTVAAGSTPPYGAPQGSLDVGIKASLTASLSPHTGGGSCKNNTNWENQELAPL